MLELTAENVKNVFEGHVLGAINVVNQVLPEMLAKKEGALLFTAGLSSLYPMPMLGNLGIAMSALRNYVANLHTELVPEGIFVGHRALGVLVKEPGVGTLMILI